GVGVGALLKMMERPNMKIGLDALRQMASLPGTMEYRVCTTDASGSVTVKEGVVDCTTLKAAANKAITGGIIFAVAVSRRPVSQ
ncbi:MAG TPA: hypothetical protein PKE54_13935, partial [Candidatus Obscuribacter sp.]|nr:hypothetical protein [Candidatus Obscuribacter sp.]